MKSSVLLVSLLLAVATATGTDNPNIILVLADDMGYGDVSACNPESKIPTPTSFSRSATTWV